MNYFKVQYKLKRVNATVAFYTMKGASVLSNLVDGTPFKDRTQFNVIEIFTARNFVITMSTILSNICSQLLKGPDYLEMIMEG